MRSSLLNWMRWIIKVRPIAPGLCPRRYHLPRPRQQKDARLSCVNTTPKFFSASSI